MNRHLRQYVANVCVWVLVACLLWQIVLHAREAMLVRRYRQVMIECYEACYHNAMKNENPQMRHPNFADCVSAQPFLHWLDGKDSSWKESFNDIHWNDEAPNSEDGVIATVDRPNYHIVLLNGGSVYVVRKAHMHTSAKRD